MSGVCASLARSSASPKISLGRYILIVSKISRDIAADDDPFAFKTLPYKMYETIR